MATSDRGCGSVLSASDIRIIAHGATTLPGNWYLDPIIDLKRWGKPRVWVRERGFEAADARTVSFERIDGMIWVSILGLHRGQSDVSPGMPFETLPSAFVYLWGRLTVAPAHGIDRADELCGVTVGRR